MRALDGAVVSQMIGPSMRQAAFVTDDHVLVYDVLADLERIYDAQADPMEEHDLREERPDLLGHFVPLARRYAVLASTGGGSASSKHPREGAFARSSTLRRSCYWRDVAFRVDEYGHGSQRMRRVRIGLMLFPGHARRRANHQGPDDPPVTHAQLVDASTRMMFQFAAIWRPFSVEEDDLQIDYTFSLAIEISTDPTPVRGGTNDPGYWTEDMSDPANTRPHRAALREAQRHVRMAFP